MIPDVLVLGGMKCGTTTLHAHLAASVGCRLLPKEAGVLTGRRGAGVPDTVAGDRGPVVDVATTYSMSDRTPDAVDVVEGRAGAGIRFVFVARDPYDRLVSHYNHERRSGRLPVQLQEAIRTEPRLVDYSLYGAQLERWRSAFGDERIHLVDFDAMVEDPADEIGRVARFIDADIGEVTQRHENLGAGRGAVDHRLVPLLGIRAVRSLVRRLPGPVERAARAALVRDRSPDHGDVDDTADRLRSDERLADAFAADQTRFASMFDTRVPRWILS